MIFHITRLILWLLPSAVGVHGIRASACRRKRLCCALCVLFFLLLASLSAVLPVENLFLHFRTPERAFAYQHMGKIEHILYGEDSCFVLYKNENGAASDCILPKTAAGYPLSTRWTKQGIVRTPITSSSFLRAEVYQARGTQDFYIYCEKFPPEALLVSCIRRAGRCGCLSAGRSRLCVYLREWILCRRLSGGRRGKADA